MDLKDRFSSDELSMMNIQFLGLKQKAWGFSRGARTDRVYEYEDGSVAVKDSYGYVFSDNGRSVDSVTRTLTWYALDGTVYYEKDISPDLNIKNLKTLNREIRQGRIDYMEGAAAELAELAPYVPEPYKTDFGKASDSIDIIMTHYEKEITHYITRGTLEFEDAIRAETNPVLVNILNLNVRPPDSEFIGGLTVKQTILHQLTGEYTP